jgi:hypothetical protein
MVDGRNRARPVNREGPGCRDFDELRGCGHTFPNLERELYRLGRSGRCAVFAVTS